MSRRENEGGVNLARTGLAVKGEQVGSEEQKAFNQAVPNTFLSLVPTTENLAKA